MTDLHLDCYAVLGVNPDAEELAIHEAFESLTQQYDPEHFAGSKDEAHQKQSDLASAYAILSDPVRRRRYDLRRRIDALIAPLTANDAPRQKAASSPSTALTWHYGLAGLRSFARGVGSLDCRSRRRCYQYPGRPRGGTAGSELPASDRCRCQTGCHNTADGPRAEIPAQLRCRRERSGHDTRGSAAAATLQQETRQAPQNPQLRRTLR